MYNIYKDQKKIGQTKEKNFIVDGLDPNTEYTLGVSKVEGDKESAVVEVKGRTSEREEIVEGEMEGLSVDEVEEMLTDGLNDVSAYHVGGGYYDVNGERVRGKEEALKLLNKG